MLCMSTFSLGSRIEVTSSVMSLVTHEELAALLHEHRTFDHDLVTIHAAAKAEDDGMGDYSSFRAIVNRSKELEDRSMRIIDVVFDLSGDEEEHERDRIDAIDYNLRRYLGKGLVSKFTPSKAPDRVAFIVTSLGGVRHFDKLNTDRRVIPHYATFVAMGDEAVEMILFANGNNTVSASSLISSEFYGLEDVTQELFVALLSKEMAV